MPGSRYSELIGKSIERLIRPASRAEMMRGNVRKVGSIAALAILLQGITISQEQVQTLLVAGHSVPVTQMNGRNYVELEPFARAVNGSLSFQGNQVALTLSGDRDTTGTEAHTAAAPEFSRDFLRTGIEAMSTIREWHSALTSALENQYPLTQDGLRPYQAQAMTNLRLAQAAATTDADYKAAQLIDGTYQKMNQLSDKYIAKRKNMSYLAPDALKNDQLEQSIIACGKSLGAMAAAGRFVDDAHCH